MKKQVVVIHGGDAFAEDEYERYLQGLRDYTMDYEEIISDKIGWKKNMRKALKANFDVLLPEMPNALNAKYEEWKLWFEKLFPFLRDDVILAGHSLGGSFLVKYLSESRFPFKIKAVFLVAACFDKDTSDNGLHTFSMPLKFDLQTDKIFLYHSKNDPVVPFSDLSKFQEQLPNAVVRVFEDRGHFNMEEFPEIVEDIKNL